MQPANGEFLLWTALLALWSFFSYAVASDPLPEDRHATTFHWSAWQKILIARVLGVALLSAFIAQSLVLTAWLAAATALHPWLRLRSPRKWTAEWEVTAVVCNLAFLLAFVKNFHLQPHLALLGGFDHQHLSATFVVVAILLFIVRGGTYIVRGCLRKTGTLPHLSDAQGPPAPASEAGEFVDLIEINRGRLIGNLERLLLTIVVAAGSYAALAFLVAAKGLVRSEDLHDREFAEYFLIGSLASVLVALCVGMIIRFALSALWPELLSLHMQ